MVEGEALSSRAEGSLGVVGFRFREMIDFLKCCMGSYWSGVIRAMGNAYEAFWRWDSCFSILLVLVVSVGVGLGLDGIHCIIQACATCVSL